MTPTKRSRNAVDLSSSDPHILQLCPISSQTCSQAKQCMRKLAQKRRAFSPHSPLAFLLLSTSPCCFTVMLVVERYTVIHTLMDVWSVHLLLSSEEGGWESGSYCECESEWRKTVHFGCFLLSLYYNIGFFDFSSLGDCFPVRTLRL